MCRHPDMISREQFELVRSGLEYAKKRTRPRKYDLYDIFCAILYIRKNNIHWRSLPKEYPDWRSVYYYYSLWTVPRDDGTDLLQNAMEKCGITDYGNKKGP